jgi:hypothetical protein
MTGCIEFPRLNSGGYSLRRYFRHAESAGLHVARARNAAAQKAGRRFVSASPDGASLIVNALSLPARRWLRRHAGNSLSDRYPTSL